MVSLDEDSIEKFIRANRNEFNVYHLPDSHFDKFLLKLNLRIRIIISIVPYLLKVAIVTVIIFIASILIWNTYIRKDRYQIKLGDKITLIITRTKSAN